MSTSRGAGSLPSIWLRARICPHSSVSAAKMFALVASSSISSLACTSAKTGLR